MKGNLSTVLLLLNDYLSANMNRSSKFAISQSTFNRPKIENVSYLQRQKSPQLFHHIMSQKIEHINSKIATDQGDQHAVKLFRNL